MKEMYMTPVETIAPESILDTVDQCLSNLADIQKRVSTAINKAATAKNASKAAKEITLGWFKIGDKAKAIEALQAAMVDVADAQGDQSDAIQMLLDYQQTVAKGMKFLLALGVYNVANSRMVIKRLEMCLKDASEEEISEMARNEMRAVIAQIKAQLDLREQQSRLAEAQRRVKEKVSINAQGIASLSEHEHSQDEELKAHREAGERLEREVERQALKDQEHDEALQRQIRKDEEHDDELRRQAQKDREHDAELKRQSDKDKEHDTAIAEIRKVLEEHNFSLIKANKTSRINKLAITLSVLSLIVSIITAIALIIVCCLK